MQSVYADCTFDCYATEDFDSDCILKCSDDFVGDHGNCPCQPGCPDGCPCPDYTCEIDDSTDDFSVLVLQHGGSNIAYALDPFVLDFDGNMNSNVRFTFEDNTDLFASCSVLYDDKWYVFGGQYQPRQVRTNHRKSREFVKRYLKKSIELVLRKIITLGSRIIPKIHVVSPDIFCLNL